jgi:transmembrane sensor
VDWSAERSDSVRRRIHKRRQRFTLSTVAVGSAALAVAVAVAIVWFAQKSSTTDQVVAEPSQIELRDGTRAAALGSGTALTLLSENDSLVTFALDAGKGWFEVTPSQTRKVEVLVRDVRVQVLGTEFVVEVKGEFVHVWVHRGKVSVASKEGTVVLTKGEHRKFRSEDGDDEGTEDESGEAIADMMILDAGAYEERGANDAGLATTAAPTIQSRDRDSGPSESSGPLENRGPLESSGPSESGNVPRKELVKPEAVDTLWKRADAARRRGDTREARASLTELLNAYEDDPRAPLAAFSLGRVLLDSGHSAKTAARAFAKARKLSPDGPLVEDALLREIESWHHAGDFRRVKRRSEKYLRLFPKGRYKKQIREMSEEP